MPLDWPWINSIMRLIPLSVFYVALPGFAIVIFLLQDWVEQNVTIASSPIAGFCLLGDQPKCGWRDNLPRSRVYGLAIARTQLTI